MVSSARSSHSVVSTFRRAFSRFLIWWGGELGAMFPLSVRRWWRESDSIVLLRLDDANAVFERSWGARREEILAVSLNKEVLHKQHSTVGRDLGRLVRRDFRLLLQLKADQVLQKAVTLPMAIEENLRQALSFELDRLTPFKPDQVYFDYSVTERDPALKRLTVTLAVIPKGVLDQEIVRAASVGVQISGFTLAGSNSENQETWNFLPTIAMMGRSSNRLWMRFGLGLVSCLLLTVLLGVPLWQKRAAIIGLVTPFAQAKTAAMETDKQRDRLDRLAKEHNLLPSKKWQSASALVVLDELSRVLKDDTFLTVFEFDGKTIQIQGESGAAAGLVELLDASPMFKDVAFKAQLTKMQGTSIDRFHIVATLDSATWPKPMLNDSLPLEAKGDGNDPAATTSASGPPTVATGSAVKAAAVNPAEKQ